MGSNSKYSHSLSWISISFYLLKYNHVNGQPRHINSNAVMSITIFTVSNMYLASPIHEAGVINHIKTRTNVRAPGLTPQINHKK